MFHVKHRCLLASEETMTRCSLDAALDEALADFRLPPRVHQTYANHFAALCAWNVRTNLTAITEPRAAAFHHYRDSLMGLQHLPDGPLVDLGSGGGFPGLVLAIARPRMPTLLVEPRRKRASFLEAMVARLRLQNVHVHCGRVEQAAPQKFSVAVTRATFAHFEFYGQLPRWLVSGGKLLCWRSAEAPRPPGALVHSYTILGSPRVLLEWQVS